MEKPWRIELFGSLCLRQADRQVTRFQTYKNGALLAYLAYYQDQTHSREVLAGKFWPEADPESGRLSLRVALTSLRRQLEPPGVTRHSVLIAHHAQVQLNPAALTTDVAEFNTALHGARKEQNGEEGSVELLARAVELYRGALLPGYYEEWIATERERLNDAYLGTLHHLCTLLPKLGNLDQAIDYAHRAVAAAPSEEKTHLTLMRLYAAAGRPADALRQYQQIEQILQDEWQEKPSPVAHALAASLQEEIARSRGRQTTRTPRQILSPVSEPSPVTPLRIPHLPLQFTRFFGREREITRLVELLSAGRIITLTGPGGTGKTRLAIETARQMVATFGGSVCFVPLTDLSDPRLIPDAVADVLGLGRAALTKPLEQVVQALSGGPFLLVLDNLEHLLVENLPPAPFPQEDGRAIVQTLLRRVPALTCLLTSRQPLEVEGETQFPVPPLPILDVDPEAESGHAANSLTLSSPTRLLQIPSVQMFVDRAQSVRPDFQLTTRNSAAVAALCARLEGLPLAIELAAAWAQAFTPAQMLLNLSSDNLLVSRRKDRPERHLSMRATIEWSYRLLTPELKRFFTRISVFAGGWTLEAAAEVCGEGAAGLGELRARSMLLAVETGEVMRYRLLEPLRQFAAEHLEDQERAPLALRHARFYLGLAEQGEKGLTGEDPKTWRERLAAEQDNLRAALDWGQSQEIGLRLAGALWRFWESSGEAAEGRRHLTGALAGAQGADASVRAKAHYGNAALAALQGDFREAQASAEASWALYQTLKDARGAAEAATLLSHVCHALGEHEHANALLAECLSLCRVTGDPRVLAAALMEQGHRHGYYGEYEAANHCLAEGRILFQESGDIRGVARTAYHQAIIQQYLQDYTSSQNFYEQALSLYRRLEDRVGISETTFGIGYIARMRGDYSLAAATLEEFLSLQRQMQLKHGMSLGMRNLGCVARDQGDDKRAMKLLQEALEIGREIGHPQGIAETLGSMGIVAQYREDYKMARALHEECLQFRRASGYKQDIAESLAYLAQIAFAENDPAGGQALLEESLGLYREVGSSFGIAGSLNGLSHAALEQGESGEAESLCLESLLLLRTSNGKRQMLEALEQAARVRQSQGEAADAACLLGASVTLRDRLGLRHFPFHQSLSDRLLSALTTDLEASVYAAAWNRGAALTLEQTIDYALRRDARPL